MSERPAGRRVPGLHATFFIDDAERVEGRALWQVVLDWARDAGVRTAFVTKGTAGFGHDRVVHTTRIEVLMFPLPMTIECVDESDRVERLLRRLEGVRHGGVVEVQHTSLIVPE